MGNKSAWQVEIGFRICGRYKGLRHAATRSGGFSGARGWCSSTRPGSRPTGAPLRSDGLTAPLRLRRPINARWGEPFLVSTLRSGDIVVLDNLGSHKGRPARQAIRGTGAKLWFLRPCSPDRNPIEEAFAKIRHGMRDARKRTPEDVAQHRGQLIDTIQPNQCRNDIQNARYASVQNRYALARVERFAAATALERWR